jgi:hypothetical protein
MSQNTAVAELPVDQLPVAPPAGSSPVMAMLSDAIQRGMSIDVIREIKALSKELAADDARRAFDRAMADAKAEIPVIAKNRLVSYENKDNTTTSYRHEDLGEIARTVDPILAKHGLSYRFRTTSEANQPVTVTCIVAHRDGHFEENSLSAGRDDSGKKNSIQQVGSTITYLQRYTLKAALGLAAAADDDGRAAASDEPPAAISEEQYDVLDTLLSETGTNEPKFLEYFKIAHLHDMPAKRFDEAKRLLEQRRKGSTK